MSAQWSRLLPALPSRPLLPPADGAAYACPLPAISVLRVTGPDAIKFLQGQVTTDMREVEKGRVLPGAICSLKGRVLFSFLVAAASPEDLRLLLPEDQLADALAHLKKYAVFSKVTLAVNDDDAVLGLGNLKDARVAGLDLPAPGHSLQQGSLVLAGLEPGRCLLLHHGDGLPALLADLSLPLVDANAWQLAEVQAGRATIVAALRDRHQPQELNYPALEGVSYQKGCYTGQEVVARLYFRGRLKQRLYRLAASDSAPAPGTPIIAADGSTVGEVVMAAASGDGCELLAVVKNAAAASGALTLDAGGPSLAVLDLPYGLDQSKEE